MKYMKKLFCGLLFVLSLFIIAGCDKETDGEKFKQEYEDLNGKTIGDTKYEYPKVEIDKDNAIKYASYDDVLELLTDGTGVIYLGYPNCPWCRSAVPALLDAADEVGIKEIYYINMENERDEIKVKEDGTLETVKEGTEGYKKLLERLDNILDEYTLTDIHGNVVSANEKRIYVPLVIFVRKGEIVGYHLDTVESQKNPFDGLDKKQKNELMDIYVNYMHKVLGDICDSSC